MPDLSRKRQSFTAKSVAGRDGRGVFPTESLSRPKVALRQSHGPAKLNRFAVQESCGRTWGFGQRFRRGFGPGGAVRDARPAQHRWGDSRATIGNYFAVIIA